MTISFTKIEFAGMEHILIVDSDKWHEPILLLDKNDIENLIKEWKMKNEK